MKRLHIIFIIYSLYPEFNYKDILQFKPKQELLGHLIVLFLCLGYCVIFITLF